MKIKEKKGKESETNHKIEKEIRMKYFGAL